jgi:hypothetical protein
MSHYSGIAKRKQTDQKDLLCLAAHVSAQMGSGDFVTIIHAGNSDYIRLLHLLIAELLLRKRRVYVFDYQRRIKTVYLQQILTHRNANISKVLRNLVLRIILDENHALDEILRLQQRTPSTRRPPGFFLIDPSGLFGRLRGGVKQTAEGLQFQYEVAETFAQKGYTVLVSDHGGRQFHRIESVVPTRLATPSNLILQFLPRQILLSHC